VTAVVFVNIASDYSLKLSEIFKRNFEQMGGKLQVISVLMRQVIPIKMLYLCK